MPDSSLSLGSLAEEISVSAESSVFSGQRVPGYKDRHLAKDKDGNLLILFQALPAKGLPAVVLENLHVEHGVRCRISNPGGTKCEGTFSIIQCTSPQDALRDYFLKVMDSVVQLIPTPAKAEDISAVVDRLATLFLGLKRMRSGPVQGLWAELFLISISKAPIRLLEAWHSEMSERYDFSYGVNRIEVKSSGNRTRTHHFSHHQAHPPDDLSVFVASLFVEEVTGGVSLDDLWNQAKSIAVSNPNLRLKVEQICIDVLGTDWERAREYSFDYNLAKHSLAFYDIRYIPKIPHNLPEGVSDVRFVSDLSRLNPVRVSETRNSLLKGCFSRST